MIACPSDRLGHLLAMPCTLLALPDHWPELRLLARVVSAAKTPSGVAAPPNTITASAVHYNTPRELTTTTNDHLTIISLCVTYVLHRWRPFRPTAAELAGEEPAESAMDTSTERDRHAHASTHRVHQPPIQTTNKYYFAYHPSASSLTTNPLPLR
eukprot:scaffold8995_cov120-Isochrysis_galbana.AAC.2